MAWGAVAQSCDGVPGVTQDPIASGDTFVYEFTAPNAGTHFFHPHVGVQIDRGLYAPLIIDDPGERGDYDDEWIVVLDDWTDGVGQNPDDILAGYQAQNGTLSGMGGMGGGSMPGMGGSSSSPLGDAGDVDYPYYLINGRVPTAPTSFSSKPGRRIRIRLINAGADTIFKVALGGHQMTVTHSDGYPVVPRTTRSLYIAMGERYDVIVTAGDGVFPLVADAREKAARPSLCYAPPPAQRHRPWCTPPNSTRRHCWGRVISPRPTRPSCPQRIPTAHSSFSWTDR